MIDLSAIAHIRRSEAEFVDDLEQRLHGQVFHVTHVDNLPSILRDQALLPGGRPDSVNGFGRRPNAFFEKRGCVSLFDYRRAGTPEFLEHHHKCPPFMPARVPSKGIVVLLMEESIHERLVPWTLWKDEKAYRDTVVPVVEAGYMGKLSLDFVKDAFSLSIEEDPSSRAAFFRRAFAHAR